MEPGYDGVRPGLLCAALYRTVVSQAVNPRRLPFDSISAEGGCSSRLGPESAPSVGHKCRLRNGCVLGAERGPCCKLGETGGAATVGTH